ncbi:MAG TPA: 50S ribosomal protein L23 [Gammaproteobacteria bacterium]|jgi:large subunit ribosomal protein L23|nr:50S ribosomal protein L23 [Gammaproteobacteria bacterium]
MNEQRLFNVIVSTYISEKAVNANVNNVYAFKVDRKANKAEVKDAVEFLFNIKVRSVRIVNVKPKKKMFRGQEGFKKAWKKAYVRLESDQKIDMPGAMQA